MDIIELGPKDPLFLAVVDQKFAVRRYGFRLDGTQICPKNTDGWVRVSELDCPYSSSTTDV
jgi:hypothetical protein